MSKLFKFGIDAPYIIRNLTIIGLVLIAGSIYLQTQIDPSHRLYFYTLIVAIGAGWSLIYTGLLMVLSSCLGKRKLLKKCVTTLSLKGDETVLDVGCGSGIFMIEVAKRLTSGKAYGLDLWVTKDQSKNDPRRTQENLSSEGVKQSTQLITGDITSIPFKNNQFDLIVSNLVLHNLCTKAERDQALDEIVRVLKPGGKLLLLDFMYTKQYQSRLKASGLTSIHRSGPKISVCPPVRCLEAIA